MLSWLPSRAEIARERQRRYAASLRILLEELDDPDWPAWPAEADASHHAWVRAHWTIAASDLFDSIRMIKGDLVQAQLAVLAQDLVDLGQEREAIRARIAADRQPVWGEDFDGDWLAWVREHWLVRDVEILERELHGAKTSLTWKGDHREQSRQHARAKVARYEALVRFDLSAQEMAPYLERRVCGIRGRYRLLGTVLEKRLGVTEADIDAP